MKITRLLVSLLAGIGIASLSYADTYTASVKRADKLEVSPSYGRSSPGDVDLYVAYRYYVESNRNITIHYGLKGTDCAGDLTVKARVGETVPGRIKYVCHLGKSGVYISTAKICSSSNNTIYRCVYKEDRVNIE